MKDILILKECYFHQSLESNWCSRNVCPVALGKELCGVSLWKPVWRCLAGFMPGPLRGGGAPPWRTPVMHTAGACGVLSAGACSVAPPSKERSVLHPICWYLGKCPVGLCQRWGTWLSFSHLLEGLSGSILSQAGYCLWNRSRGMDWIIGNYATTLAQLCWCFWAYSELSCRRHCAAVPLLQGKKAFQPRASSSILMNSIPWKVVVSLFMQVLALWMDCSCGD